MKPTNHAHADKAKNPSHSASHSAEKSVNAAADAAAKSTSAAANVASAAVDTAAKNTEAAIKSTPRLSAVDSNVNTPDQLVHAGATAMKDFIAAGTQEAQKTQQQVLSLSSESLQNFSKTLDQSIRSFNEALNIGKEQLDAIMESSKIASDLGREMHEKFMTECNDLFNENVEMTKDMLECRTLNDLVDIQNRALQNNLSRFFDQGANFAEAWFRLTTEASEPLNAQANQAASRLKKSLAA